MTSSFVELWKRRSERVRLLEKHLASRVLVLDGAMGTAIQGKNLTAQDFGGADLEGCNELLVLTRPDVIQAIHEDYLAQGADIIETNTFGGTPLVLDEYGQGSRASEINHAAVQLARAACNRFTTEQKPRWVAGSIGPTTKAISVTGGVTFEELEHQFYVQALALHEAGVDYFLLETCQDTRNIKAALNGIDRVFKETQESIPVAVSVTIEPMGTMLAGQSIEAVMAALSHRKLLYLGLNCATGPEFMTDAIRSLAAQSPFRVSCVPNAGLPDENGNYLETPAMVSQVLERFGKSGWVNVIGGCCGTHGGHIHALAEMAKKLTPHLQSSQKRSLLSGIDVLEVTDDQRPLLVGERTNVIGSRKFKRLISEGKIEDAAEVARAQIKGGAHIIDVCLANPDRDEYADMKLFLESVVKKVRVPLMIDSTDARVIEMALTYSQGKALINSVNLEDGEERFEEVVPLARKFGAALVVGTIDDDPEQGMGVTRNRKLAIAKRSYELLTRKYGVDPTDIYWDPLVFPCGTGDAQYVGSAVETIEGVRLLKESFPGTKTVLGISNVSFGLPEAGREVLNSVFLYHCVKAGLDLAIVNSEKLERYASIPEEERTLAENLLWNRATSTHPDPVAAFAAHFRERKSTVVVADRKSIPLQKRLSQAIVEGSREGLIEDLNEALSTSRPLEIINGPLMAGMDEVGRLFNDNKLIVAEVLQSAEVMKAAVAHLEPLMEKNETSTRGKVLLATVKGDVHDIGKNLVEIILANNGFQVVNLGIKIPPEQLVVAAREHRPDMIGLSGLLVKSAQMMVATAEDLEKAGIHTPILVGGAALTQTFTDRHIARAYGNKGLVAYASDAMNGLELAKQIVDPVARGKLVQTLTERREKLSAQIPVAAPAPKEGAPEKRSVEVSVVNTPPPPPDFERHVLKNTPLEQIWRYVNPLMLYGRHLGVKGSSARLLDRAALGDTAARREVAERDPRALEIFDAVQRMKEQYKNSDVLKVAAIYRYFPALSEGNRLFVFDRPPALGLTRSEAEAQAQAVFHFPRQKRENGLCLADYTTPLSDFNRGVPIDSVAFFLTTCGKKVREEAEKLKSQGEYLRSHALQALALETAEGYAEYLHAHLRKSWGFPDAPEMSMLERFQAKYRGKRYSFGYPACPRLDDQAGLWRLLEPGDIGVELTDGFMMDPEASVSALVFHHPAATYFSVGTTGELNDANRS